MKRLTLILLVILLLALGTTTTQATPVYHVYASMVTVSTQASVVGTVYYLDQPVTGVAVTLAQAYCQESLCWWVLVIPGSPTACTNDEGTFEINLEIAQVKDDPNVIPGAYVVVVGNIQDTAWEIITRSDGSIRILHVRSGKNHIRIDVHKDLPVYISPVAPVRLTAIIY